MTEPEDIIGTEQAAEIIGRTPRHVRRLADTGKIPIIRKKVGRRTEYVFDAEAVRDYAEHHTT